MRDAHLMSDFFSELESLKGGGPSATLLRQVRAVPGVRETGKHSFAIDRAQLKFVQKDGAWLAQLDHAGRSTTWPIATPIEERKLIDKLKLIAAGRDDE
jgi:hypothetical protein